MHFIDKIIKTLMAIRRTGQTTINVGVLLQNHNAKMVVGHYAMKQSILRDHPFISSSRIFTVDELADGLIGINPILVFDNTAVVELLSRARLEN
jgi:hypothetical protein